MFRLAALEGLIDGFHDGEFESERVTKMRAPLVGLVKSAGEVRDHEREKNLLGWGLIYANDHRDETFR